MSRAFSLAPRGPGLIAIATPNLYIIYTFTYTFTYTIYYMTIFYMHACNNLFINYIYAMFRLYMIFSV